MGLKFSPKRSENNRNNQWDCKRKEKKQEGEKNRSACCASCVVVDFYLNTSFNIVHCACVRCKQQLVLEEIMSKKKLPLSDYQINDFDTAAEWTLTVQGLSEARR